MSSYQVIKHTSDSNTLYCLGMLGALVYNLSHATDFIDGVWGVAQALFWPAFVVYELMGHLGM